MSQAELLWHRGVVALLLVVLLLPLAATLVYALSTTWGATILPQGFQLKWFADLWRDPRFLAALGHSLLICLGALLLSVLLVLTGTPWILVCCYFTLMLPFIYRAVNNNLQAINLRDLMDAAHLLGASTAQAALLVILPNLRKGCMIAMLLSFSFLIGEFVFANLLVGNRYETLQVYLYNMRNGSGHFTSALVISYFVVVLLLTLLANALGRE